MFECHAGWYGGREGGAFIQRSGHIFLERVVNTKKLNLDSGFTTEGGKSSSAIVNWGWGQEDDAIPCCFQKRNHFELSRVRIPARVANGTTLHNT